MAWFVLRCGHNVRPPAMWKALRLALCLVFFVPAFALLGRLPRWTAASEQRGSG
jgi:hypothetical protein